jgi:hypothetical protein
VTRLLLPASGMVPEGKESRLASRRFSEKYWCYTSHAQGREESVSWPGHLCSHIPTCTISDLRQVLHGAGSDWVSDMKGSSRRMNSWATPAMKAGPMAVMFGIAGPLVYLAKS